MNKLCLKLLISAFLLTFIFKGVIAASLSLTSIGSLNTGGSKYGEWWYTATNPTFKGTAGSDADVKLKLGSTENTVKADSSGNWTYAATLASGDHAVVISSGSESYTFTLHLGQNMPGNTTTTTATTPSATRQTTGTVPGTGFNQMVGFTTAIVLIGMGMYSYYNGMRNQKKIHVDYILKSIDRDNSH